MKVQSQRESQRGRRVVRKKNNQSLIILWVLGAIVLGGAAFIVTMALRGGFGGTSTASVNLSGVRTITAPVGTTDQGFYYKGDPNAPVKVIEYSDYQCPACANFVQTLSPFITQTYVETGRVQFIYHEYPLPQHANGPKAAEAARCAGDQGKFWQMHDVLFTNQREWSGLGSASNRFIAYARALELDEGQFTSCLNDGKYTDAINAARDAANAANVSSTPTFLVNGQPVPSNQLTAAIDAALAAAGR
jgi:protein-disulfide isomerase